jgi:hypothetical protein
MTAVSVRSLCAVIAAAIVLALAGPARAQPQPSANAQNLARELIGIIGAARDFQSVPTAVIVQVASNFLQANPKLSKDLNEIAERLVEEYNPRRGELPAEVVRLYATRFTEQELKDALAFYKSPLGKKMLSESQSILAEAARRADAWAAKAREEIAGKIRAELKKRGHNL